LLDFHLKNIKSFLYLKETYILNIFSKLNLIDCVTYHCAML